MWSKSNRRKETDHDIKSGQVYLSQSIRVPGYQHIHTNTAAAVGVTTSLPSVRKEHQLGADNCSRSEELAPKMEPGGKTEGIAFGHSGTNPAVVRLTEIHVSEHVTEKTLAPTSD